MPQRTMPVAAFDVVLGLGAALVATLIGFSALFCAITAVAVVAVNSAICGRRRPAAPAINPLPEEGSAEGRLLRRGQAAAVALGELADSLPSGLLMDRSDAIRTQASAALGTLSELGRQSAAVTRLLQRLGKIGGRQERDAVQRRLAKAEGPQKDDLRRTLGAHETRAQVRRDLAATRTALRARMECLTFGLEGLVARLAELVALAQSGLLPPSDDRIDQLTLELEGMRHGLLQAGDLGRLAIGIGAQEEI